MSSNLIQARITAGAGFTREDVDKRAAENGLSRSEFLLKAVELLMELDAKFVSKLESVAVKYKVPLWAVIQNYITGEETERKFFGRYVRGTELEFARIEGNLLGYEELKRLLEDEYGRQHQAALQAALWKSIAVKQVAGEKLTKEEQELINKAQLQEELEKALCPVSKNNSLGCML